MPGQVPRWIERTRVAAFLVSAALAVIAGSALLLANVETSLGVVTIVLGGIILLFFLAPQAWVSLSKKDEVDRLKAAPASDTSANSGSSRAVPTTTLGWLQQAPAMATAITLAITVQGVVLGLVFAFNKDITLTARVGAVSLAVGVIVGMLVYVLGAIDVSGPRQQLVAKLLFNLTLWCLFYGLLSIVATFVLQKSPSPGTTTTTTSMAPSSTTSTSTTSSTTTSSTSTSPTTTSTTTTEGDG